MAILALDCYDKNLSEEGKNNSQNYLFLTDYERVDVNSSNISNSIKGLAEKIANLMVRIMKQGLMQFYITIRLQMNIQ